MVQTLSQGTPSIILPGAMSDDPLTNTVCSNGRVTTEKEKRLRQHRVSTTAFSTVPRKQYQGNSSLGGAGGGKTKNPLNPICYPNRFCSFFAVNSRRVVEYETLRQPSNFWVHFGTKAALRKYLNGQFYLVGFSPHQRKG